MYSRGHALLSVFAGVAIVLVAPPPVHPAIVIAVALVVGVGIDFDHFVLAATVTGSSKNLRRVLRRPTMILFHQEEIFDEDDLTALQRLLSHVVIAGVAVAGLWLVVPYWALVVGVTLYVHVLADLYADVRKELAERDSSRKTR